MFDNLHFTKNLGKQLNCRTKAVRSDKWCIYASSWATRHFSVSLTRSPSCHISLMNGHEYRLFEIANFASMQLADPVCYTEICEGRSGVGLCRLWFDMAVWPWNPVTTLQVTNRCVRMTSGDPGPCVSCGSIGQYWWSLGLAVPRELRSKRWTGSGQLTVRLDFCSFLVFAMVAYMGHRHINLC